jgi:c-di-GMP-binding flagellar brake protein YcgR
MNLAERRAMSLADRKAVHGTDLKPVKLAERRWRRLKLETPVVLHIWNGAKESDVVTRSYELSEGGMAVSMPTSLELGVKILVSLPLLRPANGRHITAVVRNQRGSRCGLEFVELDDNQRDELVRHLQAMSGAVES